MLLLMKQALLASFMAVAVVHCTLLPLIIRQLPTNAKSDVLSSPDSYLISSNSSFIGQHGVRTADHIQARWNSFGKGQDQGAKLEKQFETPTHATSRFLRPGSMALNHWTSQQAKSRTISKEVTGAAKHVGIVHPNFHKFVINHKVIGAAGIYTNVYDFDAGFIANTNYKAPHDSSGRALIKWSDTTFLDYQRQSNNKAAAIRYLMFENVREKATVKVINTLGSNNKKMSIVGIDSDAEFYSKDEPADKTISDDYKKYLSLLASPIGSEVADLLLEHKKALGTTRRVMEIKVWRSASRSFMSGGTRPINMLFYLDGAKDDEALANERAGSGTAAGDTPNMRDGTANSTSADDGSPGNMPNGAGNTPGMAGDGTAGITPDGGDDSTPGTTADAATDDRSPGKRVNPGQNVDLGSPNNDNAGDPNPPSDGTDSPPEAERSGRSGAGPASDPNGEPDVPREPARFGRYDF